MTRSWCLFATDVARGQWPVTVVWPVLMLIRSTPHIETPSHPQNAAARYHLSVPFV